MQLDDKSILAAVGELAEERAARVALQTRWMNCCGSGAARVRSGSRELASR